MGIVNIKVDPLCGVISWINGNVEFSFLADVDSYALDEDKDVLFVLNNIDSYPEELILIDSKGKEIKKIMPPEKLSFSYLTRAEKGVSIICGSNEVVDGHWDWRFTYNFSSDLLERVSPAR